MDPFTNDVSISVLFPPQKNTGDAEWVAKVDVQTGAVWTLADLAKYMQFVAVTLDNETVLLQGKHTLTYYVVNKESVYKGELHDTLYAYCMAYHVDLERVTRKTDICPECGWVCPAGQFWNADTGEKTDERF